LAVKTLALKISLPLVLAVIGVLVASPVMAEKGGKHQGQDRRDDQRGEQRDDRGEGKRDQGKGNDRPDKEARGHFEQQHRAAVREYYGKDFSRGRCPPGLAKKHNGCMPPGQAKKWQIGHSLPRDVIFYRVPQPLVVQIGQPPAGYRYVRVASDILMIAIGTGMVVDAIQDLGGL
jgi:Ni/Co efflux regulator RcnB